MRKLASVSLIAMALLLMMAPPTQADRRHRGPAIRTHVFIGVPSPFWRPYPYRYYGYRYYDPYYYYPAYYYPAPYVYVPPPVIVEPPPGYAPPPPTASEGFWHYCESAGGYYPTVQTCSEAWIRVPPRSE